MRLKEITTCTIGAFVIALFSASTPPACAQTTTAGNSATFERWNPANEISVNGTIHEVITSHNSDTPAGVNLQLDSTASFQYANLGTQLNTSIKSQLAAGQAVTLKGVLASINGQNILVVRDITINQQTTHIRNDKGSIRLRVEDSAYQGNRPPSKNVVNGGAR